MTFRGNLLLYSLWYELHPFENLRRKGHHCHGLTHLSWAERKIFYRVLGKKFCGLFIYPGQSVRQVVAVSAPGDRGLYGCVAPGRTMGRDPSQRRESAVCETALRLTSRRPFAGMQGAQATARQRRRDRNGRCKPGVSRQGWKPVRAETASLAPFTTARPVRGTPGKGISRRTTKQTVIRAAVIRVRAVIRGKRLVRTVLIFTESSDQLSRATDRVPGLPASPGYVQ